MALYEKRDKMPPYLAEIPYGFKNLWQIRVNTYDSANNTFTVGQIASVTLNGSSVTTDQLVTLYDYNRDGASFYVEANDMGLFITISSYQDGTFTFQTLVEQSMSITGVLSVSGDMVDNTNPLQPVIEHDDQKLDTIQYTSDRTALDERLTADEEDIQGNVSSIRALQANAVTGITVNGNDVPVSSGTAEISIAALTPEQLDVALATKVDKDVAGAGNKIVQKLADTFNGGTRSLSLVKTLLSLEDGSTQVETNTYDLAELLGITALEAIDKPLFYYCADSVITTFTGSTSVSLGSLYRHNADGTTYNPTITSNIQLVLAVAAEYNGYGSISRNYISAIGRVAGSTASTLTCTFTNLRQYSVYNKYNGYRAGTIVCDTATQSMFLVLQTVPVPTTESNTIAITNTLYYAPIKDDTIMPSGTIWANLETTENAGLCYTLDEIRLKLLESGSGYDNYVDFIPATVPTRILTDEDWNANINLWVTDGLQFTSRAALLDYLDNFGLIDRFKISNRGIIVTHYESGGITITPVFTKDTLKSSLASVYQPIPATSTPGNLAVYDSANILVDSGKSTASFATAAQGTKADSAVQSVVLSGGVTNGTVRLTVDGTAQTAAVAGLGTAAYTEATDYATAAQGTKADSALQYASLSAGSTNGTLQLSTNGVAQNEVSVPGLGSAAFVNTSSLATAAQGAKADTAVQSLEISSGASPGTIKYNVNGGSASETSVAGLRSAAYTDSTAYATAAQGAKADSALQPSSVVDNLTSTNSAVPLSANQGRVLEQLIQSLNPDGKPIGGFATFADAYTNTSQFAADLQPINVNDTIYIAADENHTDVPTQYRVSIIDESGNITYAFVQIMPDSARDFQFSPIQPEEIAPGAVNSSHIQNGAIVEEDIADGAVTLQKLSSEVQASLDKADNALQSGLNTSGAGSVVASVTQNVDKTLTVTYADSIANINTNGTGDFVTGASVSGSTLSLAKDGTALKTVSVTGEGNVITGASASGTEVILTKGRMLDTITTSGTGNVVTAISSEGVATKGTMLASISKTGTGNVLTGVNTSGGVVTLESGTVLMSLATAGTGNVLGDISVSDGTITATKTTALTSVPSASTSQAGIVQLNNTLTSDSTDQALTAAQGKALAEQISTNDALYVKLSGNQTIAGTKTLSNDMVVPSKSALPTTPSPTTYATEAQVETRIAKPTAATSNNIAVFDTGKNVIDSGVAYTDVRAAADAAAAAQTTADAAIPSAQKGAINGVATLDTTGKVPSSQLPAMNYDPAGSAAAVQANLTSHTGNTSNPHGVTAAQVGADPSGSAAAVQTNLTAAVLRITTLEATVGTLNDTLAARLEGTI